MSFAGIVRRSWPLVPVLRGARRFGRKERRLGVIFKGSQRAYSKALPRANRSVASPYRQFALGCWADLGHGTPPILGEGRRGPCRAMDHAKHGPAAKDSACSSSFLLAVEF